MSKKKAKKNRPAKQGAARPKAKKGPARPGVKRAVIVALVVTAAAVAIAAGIGVWKLTGDSSSADAGNKRSATVKFPSWVSAPGTPRGSLKAYQAAIDYYDELNNFPCFCGCGQSAGHKSVRDCFVDSMNGDKVLFDNHGAG